MKAPRIVTTAARQLAGMRISTTLTSNDTPELWRRFRTMLSEHGRNNPDRFYSIQDYGAGFRMEQLTPATTLEKWAAIDAGDWADIPQPIETYTLAGGDYAVFIHKGLPSAFPQTAQYIFGVWLPQSGYQLDDRPHFEVLGPNYRPNDPHAEEEVWIPIKR